MGDVAERLGLVRRVVRGVDVEVVIGVVLSRGTVVILEVDGVYRGLVLAG